MGTGIHVQLEVVGVQTCPVTATSEAFEIESVTTDRRPAAEANRVVGEVTLATPDDGSSPPEIGDRLFSDATRSVYRFSTEGGCPCDRLPDHNCPVRDLNAESGTLGISFIVPDLETLRSIVSDLRTHCGAVHVRRLAQSSGDDEQKLLFVDRSAFTDRQFEVLQTAHEMGYFERPKEADSATVAEKLDISVATFSEHLMTTQAKLLDQIFAV